MTKTLFNQIALFILTFLLLFTPFFLIQAQAGDGAGGNPVPADNAGGNPAPGDDAGGNPPPGDGPSATGLKNPLNSDSITDFLIKIIDILLVLALPVIVFFIMYGGYLLVIAQGEPDKISKGRAAITWAVIGGVIVLASMLIMDIIQQTVEQL